MTQAATFRPDTFLCEITTPDRPTLRFSDQGRIVGGHYWEGRIQGIGAIKSSIGSLRTPRLKVPSLSLRFSESSVRPSGLRFSNIFEQYAGLARSRVRFLWGSGENLADYDVIFSGRVRVPGGKQWAEESATIHFVSDIERRNLPMPNAFFNATDHPSFNSKLYGQLVPRAFGNFTDAPLQYLPAFEAATNAQSHRQYFVCDPDDIVRIGSVVDGDGQSLTYTFDATTGLITIPSASSDTQVRVSLEAISTFRTSSTMAGLCQWLIVEVAGNDAGDIDAMSFSDMDTDVDGIAGRAFINRQTKAIDLIIGAMDEVFYDLVISVDDKFVAVSRAPSTTPANLPNVQAWALAKRGDGSLDMTYEYDPDQLLANCVIVRYARDPISGDYALQAALEDALSVTRLGYVQQRTRESRYLYTQTGADFLAARMIKLFGREIRKVKARLQGRLTFLPGDQFALSAGPFAGNPLQVRSANRNPLAYTNSVEAFTVEPLAVRGWAMDTSPVYSSADFLQRITAGYWTDDNGEINGVVVDSEWGDG